MSFAKHEIETLIKTQMLPQSRQTFSQTKLVQCLMTLAFFFLFLSSGFLIYAFYMTLVDRYSPQVTALFMGLILCLVSCVCAAISYGFVYIHQRHVSHLNLKIPQKIQQMLGAAEGEMKDIVRSYPKISVLAALLLGVATERKL